MNWKKLVLVVGCLLWPGPPPLAAHGLFTFAWVEGNQICTDSYFNRQSKVRGARISMIDQTGTVLASGLTDAGGGFCFENPGIPQNLTFVVEAEGGHRGQFELPAELGPQAASSEPDAPEAAPGAAPVSMPMEALRQLVREEVRAELAAQLGPLNRKLAANSAGTTEPGLKEIVGGLGWLAGLAGLGFWLTARRRAKGAGNGGHS